MAPTSHTYFDYYQGPSEGEPHAIGGNLPLEKVYGFEPVPQDIAAEKTKVTVNLDIVDLQRFDYTKGLGLRQKES